MSIESSSSGKYSNVCERPPKIVGLGVVVERKMREVNRRDGDVDKDARQRVADGAAVVDVLENFLNLFFFLTHFKPA